VSEVLSKHRKFNASFDGKVLKIFDEINLGIATATDRGLIVPVLWNANKYSLFKLSIKINELSKGARKGNISLDNLSGSTFTISNLGMFGIGAFTPIVNPPEIAILGVGEISIRPSYHQDRIKPAHTMILSLSFDHQVIDGHEAAIFLNSIANYLESFERLFDLHEMRLRRAKEKLMFEQLSDTEADYDVVILGSGPAANDAVLNLAGFDLKIAIIESEHLGGTCLNEGCVPLKKMFEIADLRRKMVFLEDEGSITLDGQFKIDYDAFISQRIENTKEIRNSMARHYTEMGISLINGVASFRDEHSLQVTNTDGSSKIITFKKAIIATGSDYIPLKDNDGTLLMDAKHFLNSKHYPSSIAFFGEDKINLELASCLSHLGVEDLYILIPHELDLHGFDEDFVNAIVELLELNNIEIYQHVSIKSIEKTQNNNYLIRFFDENEKEETIQVELIVNGGAKKPRLDNLKLSNAGIKVDESGNLILNNGYQTSNPDVFAIGDVINKTGNRLTYLASYQGMDVANVILNLNWKLTKQETIPRGLFMLPPATSVGQTESELKRKKQDYHRITYPFSRLINSQLINDRYGMMKILIDKNLQHIRGVQVIGHLSHEIISIATLAIEKKLKISDLPNIMYLHPTVSEIFKEVSLSWKLTRAFE
ncbi:MAG: 2-oxo acid dehydrogenase subunit E2, partial [Promethearchaeota archaeon]